MCLFHVIQICFNKINKIKNADLSAIRGDWRNVMRELSLKELLESVEADLEEAKKRICELKEEVGEPIGTAEYVTDDDNLIWDIENDLERLYERTNVTDNYADHQQEISKLSISDVKKTLKIIYREKTIT